MPPRGRQCGRGRIGLKTKGEQPSVGRRDHSQVRHSVSCLVSDHVMPLQPSLALPCCATCHRSVDIATWKSELTADGIFRALATPAQGQGVVQEGQNYACIIDIAGETYKALFSLEPDAHAAFRAACPLQAQAQAAAAAAAMPAAQPPVSAAQPLQQAPEAPAGAVNGVSEARVAAAGGGMAVQGQGMSGGAAGMPQQHDQQMGMSGGPPGGVAMPGGDAMSGAGAAAGAGAMHGPGGPMGGAS